MILGDLPPQEGPSCTYFTGCVACMVNDEKTSGKSNVSLIFMGSINDKWDMFIEPLLFEIF